MSSDSSQSPPTKMNPAQQASALIGIKKPTRVPTPVANINFFKQPTQQTPGPKKIIRKPLNQPRSSLGQQTSHNGFPTRGPAGSSARSSFSANPIVAHSSTQVPREATPEPGYHPDPHSQTNPAANHSPGPVPAPPAGQDWDDQGSYQVGSETVEYRGEGDGQLEAEYDYGEGEVADAGGGEGGVEGEGWMASVGKHGLDGLEQAEDEPDAKRINYDPYIHEDGIREVSPATPTLMSLDDRDLQLHDLSPPPESYHKTTDGYSRHPDHDQPRSSHSTFNNSHKPSPLGQNNLHEPSKPQSELHSLLSVSDLLPGEARPHLVRAGDRAEEEKSKGGNKWEVCPIEEWEQGGNDLVDKISGLVSRMIKVMMRKNSRANDFGDDLRAHADEIDKYAEKLDKKAQEYDQRTSFS